MPRLIPALFAIPAAVLLAAFATPVLAQHDASKAPARMDFTSCAKPVYPAEAKAAGREGAVVLAFLVDADGRASDSKIVVSSGHADLDEAARAAMVACRFHPAMQEGKPVVEWMKIKYRWVNT